MVPQVRWPLMGGPRLAMLALLSAVALALAACGGSSSAPPAPSATRAGAAVTAAIATQATTQAAAPTAASATSTPTPAPAATTAVSGSSGNASSSDLAELEAAGKAFLAANSYRETIVSSESATPGNPTQILYEYIRPDRHHYKITGGTGTSEIYVIGQTTYVKTGDTWIKTTLPGTPTVGPQAADPSSTLNNNVEQDTISRQGTETVDGVSCNVWQITDPTKSQVKMWIGASDHLPRKMIVTEQSGTQVTVTITGYDGGFSINPPI